MRKILLVIDGMADSPYKELQGKTPLEAARTPTLDFLASKSKCGLVWPIKGIAPESGEAQFVLLGYPLTLYPGRGVLEALGAGIKIKPKNLYFRANLAQVRGNKIVNLRVNFSKISRLLKKINEINKDIKVFPTVGYRAVVVVENGKLPVSNTHPGYIRYKNYSKAVSRALVLHWCNGHKATCEKINSFLKAFLKITGDKTLLLRGASYGKLPKIRKMKNWAFIGDMPIEAGLAKLAGMKILKREKNEIRQILHEKENVYVQIKGPDVFGHRGDVFGKIKAIEAIDKMLQPLGSLVKLKKLKDTILCITSDHATSCKLKRHTSGAVACMIYGKRKTDKVQKFNEKECSKGFMAEGKNLMKLLK